MSFRVSLICKLILFQTIFPAKNELIKLESSVCLQLKHLSDIQLVRACIKEKVIKVFPKLITLLSFLSNKSSK